MVGSSKFSAADNIALIRRPFRSLSRQGEVNPLVEHYGHVIVDECHDVAAVSFDAILKRSKRLAGDGLPDRRTSDSRTRPPVRIMRLAYSLLGRREDLLVHSRIERRHVDRDGLGEEGLGLVFVVSERRVVR